MLKTYLDETADSFEKLDEEPGFLYRKTDGRTSLVFCARVDKELGFLLLSAYPGILVRTSYVPMVADYCQRITPEVGVVCVESNLCEVYYRTEVAFEHAPVSHPVPRGRFSAPHGGIFSKNALYRACKTCAR